jgi:hypothetical protein
LQSIRSRLGTATTPSQHSPPSSLSSLLPSSSYASSNIAHSPSAAPATNSSTSRHASEMAIDSPRLPAMRGMSEGRRRAKEWSSNGRSETSSAGAGALRQGRRVHCDAPRRASSSVSPDDATFSRFLRCFSRASSTQYRLASLEGRSPTVPFSSRLLSVAD